MLRIVAWYTFKPSHVTLFADALADSSEESYRNMGRRRLLPGVDHAAGDLSDVVKVIAHPDRIRLIAALRRDEVDVQSLADALDLPATRVSQHLSVLRAHRIVDRRSDGRHRHYRLAEPAIAQWILDGLRFVQIGR